MNKTIAIFARKLDLENLFGYKEVIVLLQNKQIKVCIEEKVYTALIQHFNLANCTTFDSPTRLEKLSVDLILSLGGDGTLLDSALFALPCKIPVAGLNFGRLGFLSVSNTFSQDIESLLDLIISKKYNIEPRGVLKVETSKKVDLEGIAVNDFTIQKSANSSMISVDVSIDGELLNTYWADGIIISTPTGSTAYSLSCGGPIVAPNCNVMLINAVSPHQLNIRPYIVSSEVSISCKANSRNNRFLISCDSRYEEIEGDMSFNITMNTIDFQIIKLKESSFIKTLKKKLHWGDDERNINL
jgi:NAD+ kinase